MLNVHVHVFTYTLHYELSLSSQFVQNDYNQIQTQKRSLQQSLISVSSSSSPSSQRNNQLMNDYRLLTSTVTSLRTNNTKLLNLFQDMNNSVQDKKSTLAVSE